MKMGQGDKPALSIVATKKTDKTKRVTIAKAWVCDGRSGFSGQWSTPYADQWYITAIQMSNGKETRTARVEDLFLDVWDERDRGERQVTQRNDAGSGGSKAAPQNDDDIPF